MKKIYAPVFLLFLFLLKTNFSFSQPGFLDASFGNGGKVVTATGISNSVANAVIVTTEGKIVVGGYSFIAGQSVSTLIQYNSDGLPDSTFGMKGRVITSFGDQSAINSIALQPDGKIVAGGYGGSYPSELLVVRYNKNGSPDSTFGSNGTVLTPYNFFGVPGSLNLKKLIIKPDGKIVAGGAISTSTFDKIPVLIQYLPNGTIDSSFGTNGTTTKGIYVLGGTMDAVNDLALTSDRKIVAVLDEYPMGVSGHTDFAIYKLFPNGNNDSTFGTNGVVQTDIDSISEDDAYSTVFLPNNSFIVTGYSYKSVYNPVTNTAYSKTSIALVKYHPDGTIDSTFGINGKVLTLTPDSLTYGNHILLSPDGGLLVSGYNNFPNRDFLLVKYHSNGTLDSSFGTNGITTTDFFNSDDVSYSSSLQPDGKIIVVGSTGSSTNYNIALTRYNNATVYPLRLLSFMAVKNGNANLLQWQTAQETNVENFEVQRSRNGSGYVAIGYVNAGNKSYQFIDTKPLFGSNYYRLKMMDKDGTFIYSSVREITSNNTFNVNVYPNPVKDKLQVQISSDKEEVVQLYIVANDGKVVLTNQWTVAAGNTFKNMMIASLQKGSYYLVMVTKDKQPLVAKFEKL